MIFNNNIYDASSIDWDKINKLAQRVAKETKAPCSEIEMEVEEAKERKVSYGFLYLQRRVEFYKEKTKKRIADCWILQSRSFYKSETDKNRSRHEESHQYYYCLHKDGYLFTRTTIEYLEIDSSNWSAHTYNDYPGDSRMIDYDVQNMDHEVEYSERVEPRLSIVNHSFSRDKLIVSKKGDGITILLNKLLEKNIPIKKDVSQGTDLQAQNSIG
jgi:hypothetical protein